MRPYVLVVLGVFVVLGCNGQSARKTSTSASTAAPTTSGTTAATTTSTTVVTPPAPPKTLDVAAGPRNPPAAQVAPGAARVVALQARLATASDLDVTAVRLTTRGTSVPTRDFTAEAELALDQDGDGAFTARDQVLGRAPWGASFTVAVSLRGGAAQNLLVLVTAASAAQVGATLEVVLDGRDVTATDAAGAQANVTGSAAGATITIAGPLAANTWRARAKLPAARRDLAAAATTLVHAIGGRTAAGAVATHDAYDPATDRWTARAPLATARYLHGAATVNGKVYAVGGTTNGTDALASVEEYDPAADTWRAVAPLPLGLRDATAIAHQGKLWVTGGHDGVAPSGASFVYDPATNAWTSGPTVVTSTRTGTSAAGWVTLIDNGSMIFWGPGGPGSTLPAAGAFAQTAYVGWDFALRASAVAIGTRAYCVGGDRGGAPTGEVKSVDVATLAAGGAPATHASMTARAGAGVALANGRIYALGGESGGLLDLVEEFAP